MLQAPPLIQIFVLTYNRPEYLTQTLDSILNQDFIDYSTIVSDNSSDDRTENVLQSFPKKKNFEYIRRRPSLAPLAHFNAILSEVKSDYFMIFHDDDIMEPDCLEQLYRIIKVNPDIVAVGGNASIFWNERKMSTGKFINKKGSSTLISTPDEIANSYLTFSSIAPFPSYLYRTRLVGNTRLNFEEGGKHADVSFLIKLLENGSILWTHRCVMKYRKHSNQDSQGTDLKDMRELIRFICKRTNIKQTSYDVRYYRYKAWAGRLKGEFLKSKGRIKSKRFRKIYCSIFKFSPTDIFFKLFLWQIYSLVKNWSK